MPRSSHSLRTRLHSVGSKVYRGKYVERMRFFTHGRPVASEEAGNAEVALALESGRPFAAGKIGDVEMEGLRKLFLDAGGEHDDTRWNGVNERLYVNAGVYLPTPDGFRAFGPAYIEGLREMSILGVWFNRGEERITRMHCPGAKLVPIRSLEPYVFDDPWSSRLAGKRLLIATSFPRTIQGQLDRRERIWVDGRAVLPPFASAEFISIPPHACLLDSPRYPDWISGLRDLKSQVASHEFDVLLVGAGAWSVPLAGYAKTLGKVGIHLGGGLQVLFGIKGRRWVGAAESAFWNDAWTHPRADETPENVKKMERGAYW